MAVYTSLLTPPAEDPVSWDDLKAQARIIDFDADQQAIGEQKIKTATQFCELETWRRLVTQTWVASYDIWGYTNVLPYAPVQSVTKIEYLDRSTEQFQDMDPAIYEVDISGDIGVIRLAYNKSWPDIIPHGRMVRVTFVCGYGTAAEVKVKAPQAVDGILMLAAHLFENREVNMPSQMQSNIMPFNPRVLFNSLYWTSYRR